MQIYLERPHKQSPRRLTKFTRPKSGTTRHLIPQKTHSYHAREKRLASLGLRSSSSDSRIGGLSSLAHAILVERDVQARESRTGCIETIKVGLKRVEKTTNRKNRKRKATDKCAKNKTEARLLTDLGANLGVVFKVGGQQTDSVITWTLGWKTRIHMHFSKLRITSTKYSYFKNEILTS